MEVKTKQAYSAKFSSSPKIYETERGAKIAAKNLAHSHHTTYEIMTLDEFNAIPIEMEEVTNLLSGKKVMQAKNTPRCCDVSSELYWSM